MTDQDTSADFNEDALSEILEIDVDTYVEIIDCFIEDTPKILETLNNGIQSEDCTVLREQAHKLKGSSATMGLSKVSRLALNLETLGRETKTDGAAALFTELESAVTAAYTWLLALKAKAAS